MKIILIESISQRLMPHIGTSLFSHSMLQAAFISLALGLAVSIATIVTEIKMFRKKSKKIEVP